MLTAIRNENVYGGRKLLINMFLVHWEHSPLFSIHTERTKYKMILYFGIINALRLLERISNLRSVCVY